MSAGLETH